MDPNGKPELIEVRQCVAKSYEEAITLQSDIAAASVSEDNLTTAIKRTLESLALGQSFQVPLKSNKEVQYRRQF